MHAASFFYFQTLKSALKRPICWLSFVFCPNLYGVQLKSNKLKVLAFFGSRLYRPFGADQTFNTRHFVSVSDCFPDLKKGSGKCSCKPQLFFLLSHHLSTAKGNCHW